MGHEQNEFADFYRASRDSWLRAVTAVVGDRELAEEQVAEAFTRAWTSWGRVYPDAADRGPRLPEVRQHVRSARGAHHPVS
jgi:DNA-directed RNA polymerase specialized sigma24 family protein